MALSETVQESMREAETHLRNALSFAARTERPNMVAHIAKLVAQIDNIISADEILSSVEFNKLPKLFDLIISLFHLINTSAKYFLCLEHIYFSLELGIYFFLIVFFLSIFKFEGVYV